MVAHGRVELLAHPLSQKYLQMKWNAYGKYFHVTNLLIYTVFLFFVTLYASQLMQNVDTNNVNGQMNSTAQNSSGDVWYLISNMSFFWRIYNFLTSHFHIYRMFKHRNWFIPNPLTLEWNWIQAKISLTNKLLLAQRWWFPALQSWFTSFWVHSVNSSKSINRNGSTYSNQITLYHGCYMCPHRLWSHPFSMVAGSQTLISLPLPWQFSYLGSIYCCSFNDLIKLVLQIFSQIDEQEQLIPKIFRRLFLGWHLCGHVSGNFTNIDKSADGIFYSDNCIWFGFLHCSVKIKGNSIRFSDSVRIGWYHYVICSFFEQATTTHLSSSQLAFANIPMSLVRTFSMMLGEMDFVGTYVEPFWYHELPLPISSFVLLCKKLLPLKVKRSRHITTHLFL